ncbi:16S rRNA (uracil(1498)-N(3))-methyltransferase [Halomonas sp. DP8Y7-3]|uniref:16S rRNA (uracil(1498)-N(3))-methyltransferase n=1 Tax=Halomonas sp. DP8Y7-3 TaxID=2859079 RepID=UPI001C979764|nr:16S rRNA (uracil(1498)-N(3))-methyltransferase [Halomonas sp. DP8Y7-3]MBY5929659.1 16S rRNA (uracil(1498)-N(3))-methyltransferase [Halomonas sp. DP8Y7-3]
MNLILLTQDDVNDSRLARVRDPRRLAHLRQVHRAQQGDVMTLGIENGPLGRGTLLSLDEDEACFDVSGLDQAPPEALPVHLVLALPRPRMLARSIEHATALGVKHITLLHSRRVEKSYWQSPELDPAKIHQHLVLGLEQARDTRMPTVDTARGFRPFVEDRLPTLLEGRRGLLAHPGMPQACPRGIDDSVVLLIGPEGGFIDWEVEQMLAAGCEGIHLGQRILRVETAVTALLARLF